MSYQERDRRHLLGMARDIRTVLLARGHYELGELNGPDVIRAAELLIDSGVAEWDGPRRLVRVESER